MVVKTLVRFLRVKQISHRKQRKMKTCNYIMANISRIVCIPLLCINKHQVFVKGNTDIWEQANSQKVVDWIRRHFSHYACSSLPLRVLAHKVSTSAQLWPRVNGPDHESKFELWWRTTLANVARVTAQLTSPLHDYTINGALGCLASFGVQVIGLNVTIVIWRKYIVTLTQVVRVFPCSTRSAVSMKFVESGLIFYLLLC